MKEQMLENKNGKVPLGDLQVGMMTNGSSNKTGTNPAGTAPVGVHRRDKGRVKTEIEAKEKERRVKAGGQRTR